VGCATLKTEGVHTPDELIIKDDFSFDKPSSLTREQVEQDISILEYAFREAYGGRKFVPKEQMERLANSLARIRQNPPNSPRELCRQIDEALVDVQDRHLMTLFSEELCSEKRKAIWKTGTVGKNLHPKTNPPWAVSKIKIGKRTVPVISITAFPKSEDESWNGFLPAVEKAVKTAPAIVIDLRGNGGGDDSKGLAMVTNSLAKLRKSFALLEAESFRLKRKFALKVARHSTRQKVSIDRSSFSLMGHAPRVANRLWKRLSCIRMSSRSAKTRADLSILGIWGSFY